MKGEMTGEMSLYQLDCFVIYFIKFIDKKETKKYDITAVKICSNSCR
jgi:hypothetical protein